MNSIHPIQRTQQNSEINEQEDPNLNEQPDPNLNESAILLNQANPTDVAQTEEPHSDPENPQLLSLLLYK